MKPFKMLALAALTILSVSVFAQGTTNHTIKVANQQSEKMKSVAPFTRMYPVISRASVSNAAWN